MGRHSIPDPEESESDSGSVGDGADFDNDDYPDEDYPDEDYPDEDDRYLTGPTPALSDDTIRLTAQPPGPGSSGGHRFDGEWTGSHRVVNQGRRGVSPVIIIALVTVVVVVAGVIVWQFFGDALTNRSQNAAARCLDGEVKIPVLADPAIADAISGFAKTFNETAGPIGDHCPVVGVTAADSDAVIGGLTGDWPGNLGDKPAVWIPGSSISPARLQAAAGTKIVSASTSLATSPVLLAVRPELNTALAEQNWSAVPELQSDPAALDNLGLAGWGSLKLALPTAGDSDASYLAAEAIAASAAPEGAPATDGASAVARVIGGQPQLPGATLDDAMSALQNPDAAGSSVHAVAITEQQLFTRGASGAQNLAGWLPPAPVAVADYPAVLISGDWVSEEQAAAASQFERFLAKPEQLAVLSKAGFRTPNATMPASPVTTFAPLGATLSVGDDAARVALANTLSTPAGGDSTTSIMLDRSLNMASVASALKARIGALTPGSAIGLTTFDGAESATAVPLGPLSDNQQIDGVLDGLTSSGGGAVSFTTLRNVFAEAQQNFRQGQDNSVLVITAGPHTDQSLGADGLQSLIRSSADPARPVAVNVINIGDDPDAATWQAVAQLSGGQYQSVANSDSPDFVTAVNALLG